MEEIEALKPKLEIVGSSVSRNYDEHNVFLRQFFDSRDTLQLPRDGEECSAFVP